MPCLKKFSNIANSGIHCSDGGLSFLVVTPDEGGWERRLVTELEKQEKEVQRMREQQEFSLLRVRSCYDA